MTETVREQTSQRQMTLAAVGAGLLLVLGIMLAFMNEHAYRERTLAQAEVQADILAASVSAALAFDDAPTMREYVDALAANPQIAAAGVYSLNGRRAVAFTRNGAQPPPGRVLKGRASYSRQGIVVVSPVGEKGQTLGAVYLRTLPEPLSQLVGRHSSLVMLSLMALLILAALALAGRELHRRAQDLAMANGSLRREMIERAKAEEALRQSQKMESLGQLTGGVAHDFNNLLTVVIGGLETIQRLSPPEPKDAHSARLHRARDMAMQGAQRAATLTNRLLAFSRRQPLEPSPVDVNKMALGMAELLQRTLGEMITLETVLGAGLWRTMADLSQLENAVINLAVNARDAMPFGGKLTIETANAALDETYVGELPEAVPAGQYVLIAVTDTGEGMSKETLDQVFEPFFTTKGVGKGTGLGLSQVYGFVRQSGGFIRIYSEVGHGTTVKIYLPRLLGGEEVREQVRADIDVRTMIGDETVLLVEDHEDLRAHSTGILRELGYTVLEAAEGEQALALLEANPAITLLFTDIVLPGGMNGRQIADEAVRRRPQLKVLFTTGYTRNAIVHNGALDPGVQLITKPFTFDDLAIKLRKVLDGH